MSTKSAYYNGFWRIMWHWRLEQWLLKIQLCTHRNKLYYTHILYSKEGSSFLLNCNYISQYNCFYFFIKNSHETLNIDSRKQRWISLNAYFKELVSFRLRIITYFSGSAHSNVHIVQQFYLRDKQTPAVSGFFLYIWLDCVTHVQPGLWDEFFKWTDKQKHYHSSAAEKDGTRFLYYLKSSVLLKTKLNSCGWIGTCFFFSSFLMFVSFVCSSVRVYNKSLNHMIVELECLQIQMNKTMLEKNI